MANENRAPSLRSSLVCGSNGRSVTSVFVVAIARISSLFLPVMFSLMCDYSSNRIIMPSRASKMPWVCYFCTCHYIHVQEASFSKFSTILHFLIRIVEGNTLHGCSQGSPVHLVVDRH